METFGLVCLYGITTFDDIRTREIRVIELVVFAIIGIILNLVNHTNSLISVMGGVAVGVCILIISILSHEKVGRGDACIIMVTGIYLGFLNTLLLMWVSFVLAAIGGMLVLSKSDKTMEKELPFVPFLLAGYLLLYAIHILRGVTI